MAARRPRPASPVRTRRSHILPPQPPAQTQYVRPRAPCTSAPPHADGEEWGGGRVFPSSRGSLSRQFGGVPGKADCVSQSGRTTYPAGCPSPPRARAALVRTGWPETAVGPPAAPRPRRICTSGAAPAHAGARSSAPGGSLPVVPRGGRSRRAAWTGGPSRRLCARFTLRTRLPPGGVAGAAAGLRRGRPAGAPRRRAARRVRPRPFHFSRRLCSSPRFRLHG